MAGSYHSCSTYWLSCHIAHDGHSQDADRKLNDGDAERLEAVVVVDCRPTEAYNAAHVRGAVSLSLPTLMTRRLARGQLAASTVIGVIQQRQRQPLTTDSWKHRPVIFYDDSTSLPVSSSTSNSCLVMMLTQRFNDDGYRAMTLDGRFGFYRATLCVARSL